MGNADCTINNTFSPIKEKILKNNSSKMIDENVVCQICYLCFNTKDKTPMVICPSEHIVCKICLDSFKAKEIIKCPFCRVDLNIADMKQHKDLMESLGVYENEEKGIVRKNPSLMSEEELIAWTQEEAKRHNYQEVLFLILSRSKNPLKNVTSFT